MSFEQHKKWVLEGLHLTSYRSLQEVFDKVKRKHQEFEWGALIIAVHDLRSQALVQIAPDRNPLSVRPGDPFKLTATGAERKKENREKEKQHA